MQLVKWVLSHDCGGRLQEIRMHERECVCTHVYVCICPCVFYPLIWLVMPGLPLKPPDSQWFCVWKMKFSFIHTLSVIFTVTVIFVSPQRLEGKKKDMARSTSSGLIRPEGVHTSGYTIYCGAQSLFTNCSAVKMRGPALQSAVCFELSQLGQRKWGK